MEGLESWNQPFGGSIVLAMVLRRNPGLQLLPLLGRGRRGEGEAERERARERERNRGREGEGEGEEGGLG